MGGLVRSGTAFAVGARKGEMDRDERIRKQEQESARTDLVRAQTDYYKNRPTAKAAYNPETDPEVLRARYKLKNGLMRDPNAPPPRAVRPPYNPETDPEVLRTRYLLQHGLRRLGEPPGARDQQDAEAENLAMDMLNARGGDTAAAMRATSLPDWLKIHNLTPEQGKRVYQALVRLKSRKFGKDDT